MIGSQKCGTTRYIKGKVRQFEHWRHRQGPSEWARSRYREDRNAAAHDLAAVELGRHPYCQALGASQLVIKPHDFGVAQRQCAPH